MKVATKTTKAATACASPTTDIAWTQIDWEQCHIYVRKLQARIVKATKEGKWGKVKALQHLLTHSFSGKAVAVKRVTENRGKKTPGVDGTIWSTTELKMNAVLSLNRKGYKPSPQRRVFIPKANGKRRPLGIPTMKDRAMQALYLLALEPVAETLADKNSYGFRKERCTADALQQCFTLLSRSSSPQWILEGDIKGCFDNISHSWMLNNVPTDKVILQKWLKAGFVEGKRLFPTETGTPQGGIISPVLANMTLDGLEKDIVSKFFIPNKTVYSGKVNGKKTYSHIPTSGVHVVRYADDFVITASSREQLENEILPAVKRFMTERGLELSPEKTRITHIEEGFDFLGWNLRKYEGKLLTKPSKDNIKAFLNKVRGIIKNGKTRKQSDLIKTLNPVISGWANYHKVAVSTDAFSGAGREIFKSLWKWARRRHRQKGARWVRDKYFETVKARSWIFRTTELYKGKMKTYSLADVAGYKIVRHIKIKSDANPYDQEWETYFESRIASDVQLP